MGRILSMALKAMLVVFCYLLVQVESEELASTELSAALTEIKRLKLACRAPNAVTPSQAAASTEIAETGGLNHLELGEEKGKNKARKPAASTTALTSASVKCSGSAQNQTQLKGTMDCETKPRSNRAENKGSACLENLSSGKFYRSSYKGYGVCKPFNSKGAFGSITIQDWTSNQPRSGLVTKAFVAHPNKAEKDIGVFGLKRVLCNKHGGQCATFKNAVCIKCPEPIFANINEGDATVEEKSKFIDCCVLGHKQYQVPLPGKEGETMGEAQNCPANMIGTGAFTAFNDAAAELKEAYQCSGDDADKALTLVSSA